VHQRTTDARRRMVSRDPRTKVHQIWGVSIRQTPNAAKFRCPPTSVGPTRYPLWKWVNEWVDSLFWRLRGTYWNWTKVHQSYSFCTARPLYQPAKFRPILRTPLRDICCQISSISLTAWPSDKNIKQYVSAYHVATNMKTELVRAHVWVWTAIHYGKTSVDASFPRMQSL